MKVQDGSKLISRGQLSRRHFIVATGGSIASFSLLGLAGCGGGGIRLGGGGTPPTGTTVLLNFVLPPGVNASTLRCATGWSSVMDLSKPATVSVMQGNITLAYVIDTTNGKVVMVGMLTDAGGTQVFDATNIAGALIFLKMGGMQSPTSIRPNLWHLILLDPATPGLATVVHSRLTADPYAIENHDSQLLSAIQAAVSGLQQATVDGLKTGTLPPVGQQVATKLQQDSGRLFSPTAPPVPAVRNAPKYVDGDRVINDHPLFPDFMIQINLMGRESTSFLYQEFEKDGSGNTTPHNPVLPFSGPTHLPANIFGSHGGVNKIYSIPLKNLNDVSRNLGLITLSPVFDSPVVAPGSAFNPFVDTWKAEMPPMYQRVAVQITLFTFLEALGRGGVQLSQTDLERTTANFLSRGGAVQQAVSKAGQGEDLIGTVNGIVDAWLATDADVAALLYVLNGIFGIRVNDVNVALLKATYHIHTWMDMLGEPGSEIIHTCMNSDLTGNYQSVSTSQIEIQRVVYEIVPDTKGFKPGGDLVLLSLQDSDFEYQNTYLSPFRKYRWKLTGAGNATLNDGHGKTGRDFETDQLKVALSTTAATVTDQTVTVSIINNEFTSPVTSASASLVLKPSILQLLPTTPTVDPNAQLVFTLQHTDSTSFPSGTTFKWTLVGTGSLGGTSPVTTSIPTITYTAPNTPNQDVLTVEVFDAGNTSQGTITETISVAVPSRITPHNPFVKHSATQVFNVAPIAGNYPTGSTYIWSLTGHGSIGNSNPVTTSQPQITYTGSSIDSTDNLLVTVKDSNGKTVATTGTTITVSNSQVITATMHWYITSTYADGPGRTAGEFYGLAVFSALPGAKKYELRITGPDGNSNNSIVATLTAAQLAAGAPVWDPTETLYQNPNPANYPVPYGGKQHPDFVTEQGFYNAGGGIAWFYGGGQLSDIDSKFAATFATILGQQQTPASQDTFSITVTF